MEALELEQIPQLVVDRLCRFGIDLLHVIIEFPNGKVDEVGWWDLDTHKGHPITAEHGALLTAAVSDWHGFGCAEAVHGEGGMVAAQVARLRDLDPRWRFLPFATSRRPDAPQLAIGPGGIFSITVQHRPGATISVDRDGVLVDHYPSEWLAQARRHARSAAARLSESCGYDVRVQALIVVADAHDVVVHRQPDDVAVTWRPDLVPWLASQPQVFGDDLISEVEAAARGTLKVT